MGLVGERRSLAGVDGSKVQLARDMLRADRQVADALRARLMGWRVLAVNLMGSPGSGKTSLLERTIELLSPAGSSGPGRRVAVIEGDLATTLDAERIERKGAPVVQINTEGACHLDAAMVSGAAGQLDLQDMDFLFVENVGNLVCPAGWDLGEDLRVVVASVPEGDEKPRKYPQIFEGVAACVLNKLDLLPHVEFDVGRFRDAVRDLSPRGVFFALSAREGTGVTPWVDWLTGELARKRLAGRAE